MDGTGPLAKLQSVVKGSLFVVGHIYTKRADGDYQFDGSRPGPEWQGHGYFSRKLWGLQAGNLKQIRLWKHRWKHPTQGTCHSRPPDELGRLSVCSLVYALTLFAWLSAPDGLHNHEPIVEGLRGFPSPRTTQRWLQRAIPNALETQQAYRLAVIERCEPRPVESLFPRGLSPPDGTRHPWRRPLLVECLWRAYALTMGAAVKLDLPAALLLAEARGRKTDLKKMQLI